MNDRMKFDLSRLIQVAIEQQSLQDFAEKQEFSYLLELLTPKLWVLTGDQGETLIAALSTSSPAIIRIEAAMRYLAEWHTNGDLHYPTEIEEYLVFLRGCGLTGVQAVTAWKTLLSFGEKGAYLMTPIKGVSTYLEITPAGPYRWVLLRTPEVGEPVSETIHGMLGLWQMMSRWSPSMTLKDWEVSYLR